jgi:hypothetical protein
LVISPLITQPSHAAARKFSPEAPFIFTSTNKVYGDTPNGLPLRELSKRWEIEPGHEHEPGISETMRVDYSKRSLFGASKVRLLFWCRNTDVILDSRPFLFVAVASQRQLTPAQSCTVFFLT